MNHPSDVILLAASPWWRPDPGTNLVIRGGSRLGGTYPISGAKNAVLPLMVSALLTPHLVTLHNVPASLDVAVLSNLLQRLGAVLARCGEASLPMPGGDAIGLRGIDFHVAGLRAMGAEIDITGGIIHAKAPHGLHGAEIVLPLPSVGRAVQRC